MSKFDIPTRTAVCPTCAVESLHRIVYENAAVQHLRCDECDAAHVCPAKGSFHAKMDPRPLGKLIEDASDGAPEPYSIRNAYHPGGVFAHPKFGTGYVFAILSPPQKMEVLFADKVRFLVCGPGSGVLESESEDGQDAEAIGSESPAESPEAGAGGDQESAEPVQSGDDKPIF